MNLEILLHFYLLHFFQYEPETCADKKSRYAFEKLKAPFFTPCSHARFPNLPAHLTATPSKPVRDYKANVKPVSGAKLIGHSRSIR